MQFSVAVRTKRHQIGGYVVPELTSSPSLLRRFTWWTCRFLKVPKFGIASRHAPTPRDEYFTVGEPGFAWQATVRLAPLLWIEACDRLIEGRGNMLIKFCSMFTLVNASGRELDQGALLRWLAEAVWFPIGYVGDRIRWESIGFDSARATIVHEGLPVTAIVEIDGEGKGKDN